MNHNAYWEFGGAFRESSRLATAPDLAEAYYWYQAAAENGIADATQRVAEIEPQLTAAQWRALATGTYGQPGGALSTLASIDIDVTLVRETRSA